MPSGALTTLPFQVLVTRAPTSSDLGNVRWLVREEQTGSVTARIPVPPLVLLTKRQMQQIFVIVEVLLPLSVVLCGALVWWSRR